MHSGFVVRRARLLVLGIALATLRQARPQAPVLTRVLPEASSPGDVVTVLGTGLDLVTNLRFMVDPDGSGPIVLDAPVTYGFWARQEAHLPLVLAFPPPGGGVPANPLGTVAAVDPGAVSNALQFFFLEATSGLVSTVGSGTSQQPWVPWKPVISFDLQGGPPVPGNAVCTLRLENTFPIAGPIALVIGLVSPLPFPLFGDGTIVVDVASQPYVVLVAPGQLYANGTGDVNLPLPIPGPGPFGLTLVAQWACVYPAVVSNALQVIL